MPINNTSPVVQPEVEAVPELEFPQLWLQRIEIEAPTQTTGSISIDAVPYSSLSAAFSNTGIMENIHTEELWTAVSEVSSIAVAMSAIFTATTDLRNWLSGRA